jgi:hypothetical protein
MEQQQLPQKDHGVIFLGVCERADRVRENQTDLFKWNILGLKQTVLSYIYPLPLDGLTLGFAFSIANIGNEYRFRIVNQTGKEAGQVNLQVALQASAPTEELEQQVKDDMQQANIPAQKWVPVFALLHNSKLLIDCPGSYSLELLTEDGTIPMGRLQFAVVDSPPLTADRIAAIRSDPTSAIAVKLEFGCQFCEAKCRVYASLGRGHKLETEGYKWYQDILDSFSCQCGKTNIDLTIIRRNLHGVLGHRRQVKENFNFAPLYERSSLEHILTEYINLINSSPREELLQQFLANNPVLLHQFPSERLFLKPPILTAYVADFAVVTPQRELILIELEKTTTRLLKKDGGVAADLSHAFDQVRDWLHTVDEHRLAVLDSLKIDREQVSSVRGVVIAGRDTGYDAHHLRKLKGNDWGPIKLLTYDDIAFALDALIRRIDGL